MLLAVTSLVAARTYLKFAYVYGYHLPEDKQAFFDWKVKGVEEVSTLHPYILIHFSPADAVQKLALQQGQQGSQIIRGT